MANIVIFSDGTGQRSGVEFDERRSNVYKLYRATRVGPDSNIQASEQRAYYDPGIGTLPGGITDISRLFRAGYNVVSQALGLGLTGNIIDCYAALIRLWRPGDRIFLLGFSRGAYTVRCLGTVISYCGIPDCTKLTGLDLSESGTKKIARRAVEGVYQHTNSWDPDKATPRQKELLAQRSELARRFRNEFRSGDDHGPNAYPYFIGVFDTVASLSNPVALFALVIFTALLCAILGAVMMWGSRYVGLSDFGVLTWLGMSAVLAAATIVIAYAINFIKRIRFETGLKRANKWRIFHFTEKRLNFYDNQLNKNVGYARHALSIDERRSSFERVRWGDPKEWRDTGYDEDGKKNPIWFEQLWFAGNHSDTGGSYPEIESRLSDVTLDWLVSAAEQVGLKCDRSVLRLSPDPTGMQHDETKSSLFRFAAKKWRHIGHDYPLHPSVLQRFAAGPILDYDQFCNYRPENLRNHDQAKQYYTDVAR